MANTAESGFSPVRQFDPYTRPRLARWPIRGRLSQCLLLPVHVWLTAKLGADVPAGSIARILAAAYLRLRDQRRRSSPSFAGVPPFGDLKAVKKFMDRKTATVQ